MTNHISWQFPELEAETDRVKRRQQLLTELRAGDFSSLLTTPFDVSVVGRKNCENLVGSVAVPVGVAGPVLIKNQSFGDDGEMLVPLATSEGALVASVNRGCKAMNFAGGVKVLVKKIGMSRAPVFQCATGQDALALADWITQPVALNLIKELTEATSSHLHFGHLQSWVRGRSVYVRLVFDSEQAMGMNMVTIALQKALPTVIEQFQTATQISQVKLVSLSSNVCSDKKDSVINRLLGRGYWAQAEVMVSESIFNQVLKVKVEDFLSAHVTKNLVGSNLAGSQSQNMQVANVVAALYLATGQDMAHVVEGSQAATTVEKTSDGVYVAVTLPNLNLGVVGGGTGLPAQTQARKLINRDGQLTVEQLAGLVAAAALAGEISGLAALTNHTLARAHEQLGQGKICF